MSFEILNLRADLQKRFAESSDQWNSVNGEGRFFAGDSSLWTDQGESSWMGWLQVPLLREHVKKIGSLPPFKNVSDVVLAGMGGSSLCPEVLASVFGPSHNGNPRFHVADTTDPRWIMALSEGIDFQRTGFIISSKSGTTLEANALFDFFFEASGKNPKHFAVITDPGSELEARAKTLGVEKIYRGEASIGGRFSALSPFGMVPALALGLDPLRFIDSAEEFFQNPSEAFSMGVLLGAASISGVDKLTFHCTGRLYKFGSWLEQLVAESTGKSGRGIVPVDREPSSMKSAADRLHVFISLKGDGEQALKKKAFDLAQSGANVIGLELNHEYDLGREFIRWEVATAVSCHFLKVNPFDQPDVESSKKAARELMTHYEKTGKRSQEPSLLRHGDIEVWGDLRGSVPSLDAVLTEFIKGLTVPGYFGLLAFIPQTSSTELALSEMRKAVLNEFGVATVLGFGPRYLHSIGQLFKGGPKTGVFIVITCDDARDLAIPNHAYTFGVIKASQAQGDFKILQERGQKVLRLHIHGDFETGLKKIQSSVQKLKRGVS
jgi:glucose-6-phosphate isomerase